MSEHTSHKNCRNSTNDYTQAAYFFFWGHQEKAGEVTKSCLSQWYPCEFSIDGFKYHCMEQYMMASKARIMGDKETLQKILIARDPREIKKLGRQVKGFDGIRWDMCKKDVVVLANLAKFTQNKALRDFLLSTGDKVLVEASPYDTIWGIGLSADDADAKDPNKWRGKNLLGYALVEVREMIKRLLMH